MSVYRVNGMISRFDVLSDLMEYIMQQDAGYMALLDHRSIVKERDGIVIVLYHIGINPENKEIRLIRPRRS